MDEIGTVVVGIDASPGSRAALEHALQDAARRRARLRVVAVVPVPEYWLMAYGMGMPPSEAETSEAVRAETQRMVDEVVAANPDLPATVPVTVAAVVGTPAEVLVEASRDADLLVLGHRGRGGFSSAVLGSVGLRCVVHAACPVTIVRAVAAPALPDVTPAGAPAVPVPA